VVWCTIGLSECPLRFPDAIPVACDKLRADDNGVNVVAPDGPASEFVGVTMSE